MAGGQVGRRRWQKGGGMEKGRVKRELERLSQRYKYN